MCCPWILSTTSGTMYVTPMFAENEDIMASMQVEPPTPINHVQLSCTVSALSQGVKCQRYLIHHEIQEDIQTDNRDLKLMTASCDLF